MTEEDVRAVPATGTVDLAADYFELLGLERAFDIDLGPIASRYRALQASLHPDRYVAGSDAEKRWSMQASSFVNDAYETLRKPLKRAVYLLSLAGISTDEETDTRMDPLFLMQQMELREALESASSAKDPYESIRAVNAELRGAVAEESAAFAEASKSDDWARARDVVRRWQFLDKLGREASVLEANLDDDIV